MMPSPSDAVQLALYAKKIRDIFIEVCTNSRLPGTKNSERFFSAFVQHKQTRSELYKMVHSLLSEIESLESLRKTYISYCMQDLDNAIYVLQTYAPIFPHKQ